MNSFLEKIIPKRLIPVFCKIYWFISDGFTVLGISGKKLKVIIDSEYVVSNNKYGAYCIPWSSRHRPAARAIMSNDVYEPMTIEFILSNCMDGDIIHAGTYFGDFLPALSKGLSPGLKLWAFEPNIENYRCAKLTLELNNVNNVVLTNAGLGAKIEKLFIETIDNTGRSLGGASRITSAESNTADIVQIVTIDEMVGSERNVSVIQLDVEGHEKEALIGAMCTIKRCLPIIIVEVLPGSTLIDSEWLSENITSLGYVKVTEVHGNSIYSCRTKHISYS